MNYKGQYLLFCALPWIRECEGGNKASSVIFIYFLSIRIVINLLFLLDILVSREWKAFKSVKPEYLQKLARDLPDTMLLSKAESTIRTYAAGWDRWRR